MIFIGDLTDALIHSQEKTAILFFTRSAEQESFAKSYALGAKKNRKLAQALIQRTRTLLHQSDFPVFELGTNTDEDVESGYVRALESIWSQGFDRIISVGNDCPQLTLKDILKANELLKRNPIVAGPDLRGGVYLLGIRKEAYQRNLFLKLPWHSHRFFHFLETSFRDLGTLGSLQDINLGSDLQQAKKTGFLHFLIQLIFGVPPTFKWFTFPPVSGNSWGLRLRGPPHQPFLLVG